MKQVDMFQGQFGMPAWMLVRRGDPDTSHAAAEAVDSAGLEQLVLRVIQAHPAGIIQDEVLDALPGRPYSSVTARFRALLDKAMIEDTGERRPGRSGKLQRVLRAKE